MQELSPSLATLSARDPMPSDHPHHQIPLFNRKEIVAPIMGVFLTSVAVAVFSVAYYNSDQNMRKIASVEAVKSRQDEIIQSLRESQDEMDRRYATIQEELRNSKVANEVIREQIQNSVLLNQAVRDELQITRQGVQRLNSIVDKVQAADEARRKARDATKK